MARYQVRYVSYAAEQLCQLPGPLRVAFDVKLDELKRDPYIAGDYHEPSCWYSTSFSSDDEDGIIIYMISEEIVTVTLLRIFWIKL